MVQKGPAACVVPLEEREVEHPVEDVGAPGGQIELAAEMHPETAEHPSDEVGLAGAEENCGAGLGGERSELLLREELGDRRAPLAVLVDDDVCETLCSPPLGDFLEPCELRAGEWLRRDEVADRRSTPEDTELRAARHLGGVLDLHAVPEVRFVSTEAQHHLVV